MNDEACHIQGDRLALLFDNTLAATAIDVHYEYALTLIGICSLVLVIIVALRRWIAANSSGRLAQLRFRRLHGAQAVELLGGRLDPQPGSPWIDSWIDGRAIQLVAAPLDGGLQAGIQLLDHELPINIWHTSGDAEELELPPSIELDEVRSIVDELRAAGVESVTCGVPITSDPRPPHLVRIQFGDVAELPGVLARIAPLLARLEGLATRSD